MKLDVELLSPFDVFDVHHILDRQISQDSVIDQLDSGGMAYALTTGNIDNLKDIAEPDSYLKKGLDTNWIQRFMQKPFDPLCVMLAMRTKLLLDVLDEMGHSYNLMRALGYGFIDLGDIPGEDPGTPGDYYPPEIDNPIDPAPGTTPGETTTAGETTTPGETAAPGETTAPGSAPGETTTPGSAPGETTTPQTQQGQFYQGSMGGTYNIDLWPPSIGSSPAGHISAAFWNCCHNTDVGKIYVEIQGESDTMDAGTTQMLEVVGYGEGCLGTAYTWKIAQGGGELLTDEGFETFYTAPDANPDCLNNAVIELWCGDMVVDTLVITINACPESVSIGYTTQSMQVNEQQTLNAIAEGGYCGDLVYAWEIISGGGSLNTNEGAEVIYTAPATNPNCVNNPIITLKCNGVLRDNLKIAVNGSVYTGQAVKVLTHIAHPEASGDDMCKFGKALPSGGDGSCPELYISAAYCTLWECAYSCTGQPMPGFPCTSEKPTGWIRDGDGKWYLCDDEAGKAAACAMCMESTEYSNGCRTTQLTWNYWIDLSPYDYRTEEQKAAGCCPEQLL
jgi:hypothetical protein